MSVFARSVLLPWALLFASASASFAATLTVSGTPGANELIRQLAKAFERHSEINIEVVQGLGEIGGIRAVANGAIDIAISGRELNTAELNQSLVSAVRVRTPFVSVTSHPMPNEIKRQDLKRYGKTKATWSDGTPIQLSPRPRNDRDPKLFLELFPPHGLDMALSRAEIPIVATDNNNIEFAGSTPGSFPTASYTRIVAELRNSNRVTFASVAQNQETFERGAYASEKSFHFIVKSNPNKDAQRFVEFLKTVEARAIMRSSRVLPAWDLFQ